MDLSLLGLYVSSAYLARPEEALPIVNRVGAVAV